jgi:hypothetical protein
MSVLTGQLSRSDGEDERVEVAANKLAMDEILRK